MYKGHAVWAAEGSFLQRFLSVTREMSPAERGGFLEHPPPGAPDIDEAHHVSALLRLFENSAAAESQIITTVVPTR